MKYLASLSIAVFLILCIGAVNAVVPSQTSPVVFYHGIIGENYDAEIPETTQGFAVSQNTNVVHHHRILRIRDFLGDYASDFQGTAIKKVGTAFFLLIENNANAPPLHPMKFYGGPSTL